MTGGFDGTTFTVRERRPGSGLRPGSAAAEAPPTRTLAAADCDGPTEQRIAEIGEELTALPGVLTIDDGRSRHADVVFDDGSLQAWADEAYGAGVVVIGSALEPRTR